MPLGAEGGVTTRCCFTSQVSHSSCVEDVAFLESTGEVARLFRTPLYAGIFALSGDDRGMGIGEYGGARCGEDIGEYDGAFGEKYCGA